MAVKTAHGISDREIVEVLVFRGDKFGSLDKIGIESMKTGNYHSYKKSYPLDCWV